VIRGFNVGCMAGTMRNFKLTHTGMIENIIKWECTNDLNSE
jgi:hypothetical protein